MEIIVLTIQNFSVQSRIVSQDCVADTVFSSWFNHDRTRKIKSIESKEDGYEVKGLKALETSTFFVYLQSLL